MKKIWALSLFFMRSFLKQKSTMLFVVLASLFIVLAYSISDINIAKKYKLFEDLVMVSQAFLLHVAAIFYSFEFLNKERNVGVFVLPLATGLSRRKYLMSVFLGLSLMVALMSASLITVDLLLFTLIEDSVNYMVLWQIFLFMLSSMILLFLMVLFSQFVSIMNSMIYSIVIYFLGNGLDELYYYAYYLNKSESLQWVYQFVHYMIPNFALFDKQGIVVNHADFDFTTMFVSPLLYMFIVTIILFSVASLKFEKRALKVGQ